MTYRVAFDCVIEADSEEEAVEEARQLVSRPDYEPSYIVITAN